MSTSIEVVVEHGGFDISTYEDANWLLAQRNEWDEMIERAQQVVDDYIESVEAADQAEMEAEE